MLIAVTFALLVVLLLFAVIGRGLVALFSSGPTGRWGPLMIASVLALAPMGGIGISFVLREAPALRHKATAAPSVSQRTLTRSIPHPTVVRSAPQPHEDRRWRLVHRLLPDATADLYPSQEAAEAAVAAAVATHYGDPRRARPVVLTVIDRKGDDASETHPALADAIRRHGLKCVIKPSRDDGLKYAGLAATYIPITEQSPLGEIVVRDQSGTAGQPPFVSALFVEKNWVTDLAKYRATQQTPNLVMALSGHPERTESAARESALQAVEDIVAPRLVGRWPEMGPYPLRYMLTQAVRNRWSPRDTFTQRLDHPTGPSYRTAFLIDTSHNALNQLSRAVEGWTPHPLEQQTRAFPSFPLQTDSSRAPPTSLATITFRIFGLGILVGLTLLIYTGLDRWTRGYRPVAVSTTAIVLVLGGAALLGLLAIA